MYNTNGTGKTIFDLQQAQIPMLPLQPYA